jgi:hypothetical protein
MLVSALFLPKVIGGGVDTPVLQPRWVFPLLVAVGALPMWSLFPALIGLRTFAAVLELSVEEAGETEGESKADHAPGAQGVASM